MEQKTDKALEESYIKHLGELVGNLKSDLLPSEDTNAFRDEVPILAEMAERMVALGEAVLAADSAGHKPNAKIRMELYLIRIMAVAGVEAYNRAITNVEPKDKEE